MIGIMARRELRSMFVSPLGWVILAVVMFILAWLFMQSLNEYLELQSHPAAMRWGAGMLVVSRLFHEATLILLLVVPLLTMRLVSEERRSGSLPLLLSAPLSSTQIVLGKYLGVLGFLAMLLTLICLLPLSLLLLGSFDWGVFAACVLGLALMLAAFASAGLYMSTLAAQPTVAAVSSFGLLLLLLVIDIKSSNGGALSYLSMQSHYASFRFGRFDSSDVAYYLLFTLTFLVLSVKRLERERMGA